MTTAEKTRTQTVTLEALEQQLFEVCGTEQLMLHLPYADVASVDFAWPATWAELRDRIDRVSRFFEAQGFHEDEICPSDECDGVELVFLRDGAERPVRWLLSEIELDAGGIPD